jgi:hypothetical protein
MSRKDKYPHLWAFFDGAFSANSGGKAKEEDFDDFTSEQMEQAEKELTGFNKFSRPDFPNSHEAIGFSRWLGMMADSGYNVWGQTYQDLPEGSTLEVDDEQHRLLAFELLDKRY